MKKLLILLLTVCLSANAQQISQQQALEKAHKFISSGSGAMNKAAISRSALKQVSQQQILSATRGDQLFIYNVGNDNGFVIVSGDERTPDILGYADHGSIDPQNMPENMRSWLQGYVNQINNLTPYSDSRAKSSFAPVSPLVTAQWNQYGPYYNDCPVKGGNYCLTGCVATAMAQVLYYVQPAGCTALAAYGSVTAKSATTFNWGILRDTYKSDDNDASAKEVAKLMRYCGQSVQMSYGTGGSSAGTSHVKTAFINNFDLSNSCRIINRSNYSSSDWENKIYAELAARRPMIFDGRNIEGGHAFVCDGYDGAGLYHINWGWGGMSNGYFLMNRLSPDYQGAGGTNDGYNNELYAITGIQKKSGPEENITVLDVNAIYSYTPSNLTRTSTDLDFTMQISAAVFNMDITTNNHELCWGLFDDNENLLRTSAAEKFNVSYGYGYSNYNMTIALGKGISSGRYYIMPVSHQSGATGWALCNNYNLSTLIIDFNGNKATVSKPKAFGTNFNYAISNFQITGNRIINAPQDVTFTVKNNGDYYSTSFYIIVDGTLNSQISIDVDPGESATINGKAVFYSSGSHSVILAREVSDGYAKLYETTYTADPESYSTLSFKLSADAYIDKLGNTYIVDSPNILVNCEMTNTGSEDYKSSIMLWSGASNEGTVWSNSTEYVSVNRNGKGSIKYPINNLPDGVEYAIYGSYYNGSNYTILWDSKLLVKYDSTTTGIHDNSLSPAPSAPAYSLDGTRVNDSYRGIVIRNGKKFVSK